MKTHLKGVCGSMCSNTFTADLMRMLLCPVALCFHAHT